MTPRTKPSGVGAPDGAAVGVLVGNTVTFEGILDGAKEGVAVGTEVNDAITKGTYCPYSTVVWFWALPTMR